MLILLRAAYAAGLWLALPWLFVRLWWRGRREPLYRSQIGERFGRYSEARTPSRPVIWLHAVSLGETRAAQPLFRELAKAFPEYEFVVTHMTSSGRQSALQLYGKRATLAWLPYDYPFAVRRFLARFRPALGILMETEVWFNLVRCCRSAAVPLVLANARLSEKSLRGYRAVGPLAREAFASLSAVAAQSEADAARLVRAGARSPIVTGNIKFDVQAAADTERLARELRHHWGDRHVFLAASTREGEEELLLEALAGRAFAALTVLVPRHPQRFEEVAALLEKRGLDFVRRSEGCAVPPACRFVLGDSMGELAAYYTAADVAFVGGSLLPYGGQNLIEACAAGVPVVIGPSTYNFEQAAEYAVAEGAALRVANADALISEVERLLSDREARHRMTEAGQAFCGRHRGATQRVVTLVDGVLSRRDRQHG